MPESVHPALRRRPLTQMIVLGVLLVAALLAVPSAHAEEVFTGQAAAARATDSTWIPTPAQRAAVCIVDTGNGNAGVINPDLSNVVARFATDGGSGDDLHADRHGTLMSMIASAPYNQFGMVGAAPSINVVSVRASRDGRYFGSADITTAINTCVVNRAAYDIKVVSLSLGGPVTVGLDSASMAATQDAVDTARRAGLNVVAAAGNHPGAVDWPAGYAPVLAIGAADSDGVACSFAASGPEVDLWASGCPQDVAVPDGRAAWAQGSSESTAFVAGVLTQLRELRPDLSATAAEQLLTANVHSTAAGQSLDVDAAFRAAGLADQLAAGHAAIPVLQQTSDGDPVTTTNTTTSTTMVTVPGPTVPDAGSPAPLQTSTPGAELGVVLRPPAVVVTASARFPRPAVRSVRYRRGLLTLTLTNRPKGVQARAQLYARRQGRPFPTLARSLHVTGDRLRIQVSGTLSQVSITYRDPHAIRKESAPLSLHFGT